MNPKKLRELREREAELRRLIPLVLADAPEEHDLVVRTALADPEAALISFRALAAEQGLLHG
jgi:hypothetical protein